MPSRIIGDRVLWNWTCKYEFYEVINKYDATILFKMFGPQSKEQLPISYFTPDGAINWYGCQWPDFIMIGIAGIPGIKFYFRQSRSYTTIHPDYKVHCVQLYPQYTLANCTKVPMYGPIVNISFGSSKALVGVEVRFMSEYLAHIYNFIVCDVVHYCDIKATTFLGYSKHLIITPHSSKSNQYWFSCVDDYTFNGTSMLLKCNRKGNSYPNHFDDIQEMICVPTCCALDMYTDIPCYNPINYDLLEYLTCVDDMIVVNCPKITCLQETRPHAPMNNCILRKAMLPVSHVIISVTALTYRVMKHTLSV